MHKYFDLEISLLEIEPRIWRHFRIRSEATFMHFHSAIQQAFGWQNYHLYEFLDGKVEENDTRPLYAMKLPRIARSEHAEPLDDEPDAPIANAIELGHYLSAKNRRCFYVYDFGDNWQHLVEVKEVVEMPEEFTCRLLDGARACPREDCGGTMGYEECCEAARMSKEEVKKLDVGAREEIEWRQEWLDGRQPESFDLEAVRKRFDCRYPKHSSDDHASHRQSINRLSTRHPCGPLQRTSLEGDNVCSYSEAADWVAWHLALQMTILLRLRE